MPVLASEDGGRCVMKLSHGTVVKDVPVEFCTGNPNDATQFAKICSTPKFANWAHSYAPRLEQKLSLNKIKFQSIDFFGEDIGFIKLEADITRKSDGLKIPGVVLLRGHSVAILIVFRVNPPALSPAYDNKNSNSNSNGDGESGAGESGFEFNNNNINRPREYILFVRQPRGSIGSVGFLEIPAGMMDQSGSYKGVASRELEEECGLKISQNQLTDLTSLALDRSTQGIALSPGLVDERIRLLLYRETVTKQYIENLQAKRQLGNNAEGESITLEVVPLGEAWRKTTDAKSICALFLLHELRYHNLMPKYRPIRDSRLSTAFTLIGDLDPNDQEPNLKAKVYTPLTMISGSLPDGSPSSEGEMYVGDASGIVKVRVSSEMCSMPEFGTVGSPLIIRNIKFDMSLGRMTLVFDKRGQITSPTKHEEINLFNFEVNAENDVTAAEYEKVTEAE